MKTKTPSRLIQTLKKSPILRWALPVGFGFSVGVASLVAFNRDTLSSLETATAATTASATSPTIVGAQVPPPPLSGNPNIFVSLAKLTVPSVVNIQTMVAGPRVSRGGGAMSPEEFFRRFFEGPGFGGGQRQAPIPQERSRPRLGSLGTGFIIDASGIILTNQHVVAGADQIKIQFTEDPNEKPTDGKIIARDPDMDIALIQVKTDRKLTALALGDSDALEVGEYVMAVGNPFGQGHSVTHGIISAKNRSNPELPFTNYLQTDAPINPGNSGGPLLNLRGEVIGVNNAIDARAQNIGFAIPINAVKANLTQLKSSGKVSRGYLGVAIDQLSPEMAAQLGVAKDTQGVVVMAADPGQPAFKAGVRPYDIVTEIEGKRITLPSQLTNEVSSAAPGKKLTLKIIREGKTREITVKVGERPNRGIPQPGDEDEE
jgi:serine protease Do